MKYFGFDFLLTLFIFFFSAEQILCEIRCFCNEASCVRTSYMCKSLTGSCYTRYSISDSIYGLKINHGCTDTLSMFYTLQCSSSSDPEISDDGKSSRGISNQNKNPGNNENNAELKTELHSNSREAEGNGRGQHGNGMVEGEATSSQGDPKSLGEGIGASVGPGGGIGQGREPGKSGRHHVGWVPKVSCCDTDMCNYPTGLSLQSDVKHHDSKEPWHGPSGPTTAVISLSDQDLDLWFKAAVISVPVLGLLILVILIIMASRMLRAEQNYGAKLCSTQRLCSCGYNSVVINPLMYQENCIKPENSLVKTVSNPTTSSEKVSLIATITPVHKIDLMLGATQASSTSCCVGDLEFLRLHNCSHASRDNPHELSRTKINNNHCCARISTASDTFSLTDSLLSSSLDSKQLECSVKNCTNTRCNTSQDA